MTTSAASTALLAAAAASMLLATSGEAKPRRDGGAVVRTCSLYGNGCISAPVRQGRFDYELRLPGGTWISCKRDCKTTLREETVDFWETLRERAPDRRR